MMGMEEGPGGSLCLWVGLRREKRELRSRQRDKESRMMNQVSMFVCGGDD